MVEVRGGELEDLLAYLDCSEMCWEKVVGIYRGVDLRVC